jgi:hypothetical protein
MVMCTDIHCTNNAPYMSPLMVLRLETQLQKPFSFVSNKCQTIRKFKLPKRCKWSLIFCDIKECWLVICYQSFGTTYRLHLQGTSLDFERGKWVSWYCGLKWVFAFSPVHATSPIQSSNNPNNINFAIKITQVIILNDHVTSFPLNYLLSGLLFAG